MRPTSVMGASKRLGEPVKILDLARNMIDAGEDQRIDTDLYGVAQKIEDRKSKIEGNEAKPRGSETEPRKTTGEVEGEAA